ncbi:hypothetical protein, partial [Pseudonocardia sp. NPDC049154]|uniref:hypothetical protein n=1 Tax=Pseudonocardia sp. NPDC049154 TaxID=3155501 RepID=UPI0033EA8F70
DEVAEHGAAAAAVSARPAMNLGVTALAAAYAGDLDRARELQTRTTAAATSPTGRAFAEYVAGEIANAAGEVDRAEPHYLAALDLARTAGSTFVTGIASVGLLSARAAAGRVADALRGYRVVVDRWVATGQWTQLWVTLRNLADLLRLLDDDGPAALLDAAADAAPDAPPRPPAAPSDLPPAAASAVTPAPGPRRAEALEVARRALDRHLAGEPAAAGPSLVRAGPRQRGGTGRGRPP